MEGAVQGVERKRRMLIKPVTPLARWMLESGTDAAVLASRCDVNPSTIYTAARGARVAHKTAVAISRETGIDARDLTIAWSESSTPAAPAEPKSLVQNELPVALSAAQVGRVFVGTRRTTTSHRLTLTPSEVLALLRANVDGIADDAVVMHGDDGGLVVTWEDADVVR